MLRRRASTARIRTDAVRALTREAQGLPQFQAYVNRYGPGLVIYWLGFVEELNSHPHVLLMDSFPLPRDVRTIGPPAAASAPVKEAGQQRSAVLHVAAETER
jgi:hypothetical protein